MPPIPSNLERCGLGERLAAGHFAAKVVLWETPSDNVDMVVVNGKEWRDKWTWRTRWPSSFSMWAPRLREQSISLFHGDGVFESVPG